MCDFPVLHVRYSLTINRIQFLILDPDSTKGSGNSTCQGVWGLSECTGPSQVQSGLGQVPGNAETKGRRGIGERKRWVHVEVIFSCVSSVKIAMIGFELTGFQWIHV